jgi:lipopolysaccharide export LptBFGC system permease protein LptF
MRILHRYILKELLKSLALSLPAIAGVFSFAIVLKTLQSNGLGPLASLKFMALTLPGACYLALPLSAVLVATLIYGRLTSDNEVMACRASGIPVSSLLWPAFLLAIISSGLTLTLAAWPLPESHYAAQKLALEDIENLFFSQLSNGRFYFKDANFQMTVDRVVGDMLYGPTVKHRGDKGQTTYSYAPYGRVEFDKADKSVTLALWEAVVVDESHAMPMRGDHRVSVPLLTSIPRKADDLSLWWLMAVQNDPNRSDEITMLADNVTAKYKENVQLMVRAKAIAEFNNRLAGVLGCLGLVLLGAGLGMYFHSGNLLTAFGVALVPWLLATLLTKVATQWVGDSASNAQSLAWVIWTPNILMLMLGAASTAAIVWVWGYPVQLRHRLLGRLPGAGRVGRSAS